MKNVWRFQLHNFLQIRIYILRNWGLILFGIRYMKNMRVAPPSLPPTPAHPVSHPHNQPTDLPLQYQVVIDVHDLGGIPASVLCLQVVVYYE